MTLNFAPSVHRAPIFNRGSSIAFRNRGEESGPKTKYRLAFSPRLRLVHRGYRYAESLLAHRCLIYSTLLSDNLIDR